MNSQNNFSQIDFLYTNIGRGHPFYLDGINEALLRKGKISLIKSQSDVFELSSGISKLIWQLARWLYTNGSSNSTINKIYEKIRKENDYNRPSIMLKIMGHSLKKRYFQYDKPIVVAHPLLAAILCNHTNVIYQHGELVVPNEALVRGADFIIVPTQKVADRFIDFGYDANQLFVSGLCIEPAIVRQANDLFTERHLRIEQNNKLTGAFFSSGAEPKEHLEQLIACINSSINEGGRVIVFVKQNGKFEKNIKKEFNSTGVIYKLIDSQSLIPNEIPNVSLVSFKNRREENIFSAKLFKYFDYFVSPSHERTNWAVGLGLPIFTLSPTIGTYSPLNAKLILDSKIGESITDINFALNFGSFLNNITIRKKLMTYSQNGWGNYKIDGFNKIADFLIEFLN
ncbi:MAG: hypothetical protein U9N54_13060 [candidate division Zixibacteria bacterium]|nr:hypothetical protein [candidate division Zixibacteria bacterium]